MAEQPVQPLAKVPACLFHGDGIDQGMMLGSLTRAHTADAAPEILNDS